MDNLCNNKFVDLVLNTFQYPERYSQIFEDFIKQQKSTALFQRQNSVSLLGLTYTVEHESDDGDFACNKK